MTTQLAWLWNSITPTAPSGRLNATPNTDHGTPLANDTMHIPNGGGGGVEYRTTATESMGQADQGKILSFTGASPAITINTPTDAEWKSAVFFNGSGTATITPASGTINGAASVSLNVGQNGVIWWDGANYLISLGGGAGTSLVLETNGSLNSTQILLNLTGGIGIAVSESAGTVTIAASGSSGGASPSSRRWGAGISSNADLSTAAGHWVGDSGQSVSGTASFVLPTGSSTFPCPVTTMTTGAVSGNNSLLESNCANTTTGWVQTGKNMLFECYIAPGATITSVRYRLGVGMTNSATTWLTTDTITSVVFAAFRFSTAAGDTNWMCETGDASAETVDDSGIAVVASTLYKLQIQFNDAVPNVVFSINGTVVKTHTTHLPGANKALAFLTGVQTLTTAARVLNISWIYEEADN